MLKQGADIYLIAPGLIAFSGILFGVVLIVSQLLSERTKLYKKLDNNERYEWVASLSNFILSIVSTVGALYILSRNEWYLDHPGDSTNNVNAYDPVLNFFGIIYSLIILVLLFMMISLHSIHSSMDDWI